VSSKAPARKRKTAPAPRRKKKTEAPAPSWLVAVRAAESKKATDIRVLDLREVASFADYFVLCTGASSRQVQAIGDEVVRQLKALGERPASVEGYGNAEWILADFGDFLVHVFSPQSRQYYDLDRLWRDARQVEVPAAG
jgi:ribosome-associated protein